MCINTLSCDLISTEVTKFCPLHCMETDLYSASDLRFFTDKLSLNVFTTVNLQEKKYCAL